VLDLRPQPAFTMHQPPQGYFHAGRDERRADGRRAGLREMGGRVREAEASSATTPDLCAHSRNEQTGCTACIDVCSARAIRSDASRKGKTAGKSQFHGVAAHRRARRCWPTPVAAWSSSRTCAWAAAPAARSARAARWPSPTPMPVDQGKRMRTMLRHLPAGRRPRRRAAAAQPGRRPAPDRRPGPRRPRDRTAQGLHGVPARVLPVALWHTASVGLDLWLAAIAQGASQVWVLLTDEEAPEYRQALAEQMAVANAILQGLGYAGEHLRLLEARDARDLAALDTRCAPPPAQTVARPPAFAAGRQARHAGLALDHLLAQAPAGRRDHRAAAAGAPFGSLQVDTAACTLCLSCVSACPAGALADNPDKPQLRFIEKNCVQCGLCATTCPEKAITLQPRLWLADGGKARARRRGCCTRPSRSAACAAASPSARCAPSRR
jgi:ferredoxin